MMGLVPPAGLVRWTVDITGWPPHRVARAGGLACWKG
jgi:hypothetical protein